MKRTSAAATIRTATATATAITANNTTTTHNVTTTHDNHNNVFRQSSSKQLGQLLRKANRSTLNDAMMHQLVKRLEGEVQARS